MQIPSTGALSRDSFVVTFEQVVRTDLSTKCKGDFAELMVAADLMRRGHRIAIPYGEDWDFDLIVCREDRLERIQVKHAASRNGVLVVKCGSHSLTNGKVRRTKHYTSETIDWIAAYDASTEQCFYVPARELGSGRSMLHLRLAPTRNGQRAGIRDAADYRDLGPPNDEMEPAGFEPATFRMQTGRSPS